jgi:hypothetical protein
MSSSRNLKLSELKSERVNLINEYFDNLYELTSQLYERIFDKEDIQDTKLDIINYIKKTEIEKFETDE